jgi:Flp pilus assembly protein TadG
MSTRLIKNQRGAALLETAITLPLVLLVAVAIFEFGRAYQTWQVLTNAAREGARIAVITGTTDQQVTDAVRSYMTNGRLTAAASAGVAINRNTPMGANTASSITINYPFSFIVLNPVARLVVSGSNTGSAALTMQSVAVMRNES